jgi:hypothetical protein
MVNFENENVSVRFFLVRMMKTLKAILLAILIFPLNLQSKRYQKYHKFVKVECGSSLKTASKPYCYLKSYVRNHPLLFLGYTLNQHVVNGKVKEQSYIIEIHKFKLSR